MAGASSYSSCIFCQIARSLTSTNLLHNDEKVIAFQDINPSAFRHYLVIPVEHISTVNDLSRRTEDFSLVSHMLNVGQTLLSRDAPRAMQYRFGFHQPPFNSVNHLHLHCLALPFIPRWKSLKYSSLGPLGGFIEAQKLLERIKPLPHLPSQVVSLTVMTPQDACFSPQVIMFSTDPVAGVLHNILGGGPKQAETGIWDLLASSGDFKVVFARFGLDISITGKRGKKGTNYLGKRGAVVKLRDVVNTADSGKRRRQQDDDGWWSAWLG